MYFSLNDGSKNLCNAMHVELGFRVWGLGLLSFVEEENLLCPSKTNYRSGSLLLHLTPCFLFFFVFFRGVS